MRIPEKVNQAAKLHRFRKQRSPKMVAEFAGHIQNTRAVAVPERI